MQSPNSAARPVVKLCKSCTAAEMKNWQSRFRHGTIQAIDGENIDTIEDVCSTVVKLKESSRTECTITMAHHEIAKPLRALGIPQIHFDQLHAIAHHLHVMKHGEDYDLWGDNHKLFPAVAESAIHQGH
jgi:hypothetical protein